MEGRDDLAVVSLQAPLKGKRPLRSGQVRLVEYKGGATWSARVACSLLEQSSYLVSEIKRDIMWFFVF